MTTRSSARSALLIAALAACGCASTQSASGVPTKFVDPDGLFKIEVGSSFMRGVPPNDLIKVVFQDKAADIVVMVLVDSPPVSFEQLDRAVRVNAEVGYGQEAVHVTNGGRQSTLGNLEARETEFIISTEAIEIVTFNLHTSTEKNNFQLVVVGPKAKRSKIARVLERLRDGGFQFLGDVKAAPQPVVMPLNDPTLPYAFSNPPSGWKRIEPTELDPNAVIAMNRPEDDMWLLAGPFPIPDEARQNGSTVKDILVWMEATFHKGAVKELAALPQGNTDPYDRIESENSVRWSSTGVFSDMVLTYRFRMVHEPERVHTFTCWGSAAKPVAQECDQLFDSMSVRAIPKPVRPAPAPE